MSRSIRRSLRNNSQMRVRAAFAVVAVLAFGCIAATAAGQNADGAPECDSPLVPERDNQTGVLRCVKAQRSPAAEFASFILGNRFHHRKHTFTFCNSSRYQANATRGRYRIVNAKRVKRKSGRVTIMASIRLKSTAGKSRVLRAVLAMNGLKLDGEKFGFGGPAPPSVSCAPK